MTQTHPQGVLEAGYQLLWYRIGRVLGRGAFGITYLAEDVNLNRPVAIKEFFPSQHCTRAGTAGIRPLSEESAEDFKWAMERFLSEGRTLAHFEHPNIIRVLNVFEANGTAYMVMNYESGTSLSALLKRRRTLNEREIGKITLPILDGLEKVHAAGFIHRDIKPSNIYIREGGSPVLLDFGSARQSMQEYTQTLTSLVSPGYAPIEQYTSKGDRQGPWTDIYGFGATLYRTVTGLVPPSAVDRSEALSDGKEDYMTPARELVREPYSDPFLNAIDHALAYRVEDRPQSVTAWRSEFGFEINELDTQPEYYTRDNKPPDRSDTAADDTEPLANPSRHEAATEAVTGQANTVINIADGEAAADGTAAAEGGEDPETATVQASGAAIRPEPYQVQGRTLYVASVTLIITVATGLWFFPAGKATDTYSPLPGSFNPSSMGTADSLPAPAQTDATATPATAAAAVDQQQIEILLEAARADYNAMRLTTPPDRNAYDKFRAVQAIEPDNADAQRGIDAIYMRYLQLAQQASGAGEFDRAAEMLDRAQQVRPAGPGLMRARVSLEQRRNEESMRRLSRTLEGEAQADDPESTSGTAPEAGETVNQDEAIRRQLGGRR